MNVSCVRSEYAVGESEEESDARVRKRVAESSRGDHDVLQGIQIRY